MYAWESGMSEFDGKDEEVFAPQSADFMKDVHTYREQRRKSIQSDVYFEASVSSRRQSFSLNQGDMVSLINMTRDGINTINKSSFDNNLDLLNENNNGDDNGLTRDRGHSLDGYLFESKNGSKVESKQQAYVTSLEKEVFELKNELNIAGKLGQNLYKMSKSKDREIESLKQDNLKLKESNKDLEITIESLRKQTEMHESHYESHVSDLREKLVSNEESRDNILEEMAHLQQEIKKLQIENTRLAQINDEIEFDNTTLKQEIENVRENASYEIENTSREYAWAKDQSSVLRQKNNQLTDQISDLKKQNEKLRHVNEMNRNANKNNDYSNNRNQSKNNNSNNSGHNRSISAGNQNGSGVNGSDTVLSELNRQLNIKSTEVEGLTEQLNDSKEFLENCLFLLEEYTLAGNEDESIELSQIYSDCARLRRFLGKSGAPPQPKPKVLAALSQTAEAMDDEKEKEREREREREQEIEREKERERERQKEKERAKVRERERRKEMERQKVQELEREREKEKQLLLARELERERKRGRLLEKEKKEKDKLLKEKDRKREKEREKEKEKFKAIKQKAIKQKQKNKKNKNREPSFEEQKFALIEFFTSFSNPKNWKESEKIDGVQRYELSFWQCEPLRARMVFLYSMTLYLSQIVGINKRCISHAWMLFKSPSAQIDTLCEEFDLILTTLEHHNDKKLWKYIFSFLYNVATYFKHIQKFVGSRTPISSAEHANSQRMNTQTTYKGGYKNSYISDTPQFRRATNSRNNVYGTTSDTQSNGGDSLK